MYKREKLLNYCVDKCRHYVCTQTTPSNIFESNIHQAIKNHKYTGHRAENGSVGRV